jgi:hypothetical protein
MAGMKQDFIAIVDDEPMIRQLVSLVLSTAGYETLFRTLPARYPCLSLQN